jgi:hypothetical protein
MPCFTDERGLPRIMYVQEAAHLTLGPMAVSKITRPDNAPKNDECVGCCCSFLCFPVRILLVPFVACVSVCETVGHKLRHRKDRKTDKNKM